MTKISRTNAGGGGEVSFVADVTVTAEGSDGVDALTVPTEIRHHLALVDVWKVRDILEMDLDRQILTLPNTKSPQSYKTPL